MPFIGLFVQAGVFEILRGGSERAPDRVIMDEGAWLPQRIRYMPRWHHTGSYQLYPGEEIAGVFIDCFPAGGKCRAQEGAIKLTEWWRLWY